MKKRSIILIECLTVVMLLAFAGCASTGSSAASSNSTSVTSSVASAASGAAAVSSAQKVFTKAELAKYNGQNGNPAYVAVSGVVYDVTNAKDWSNGQHHGLSAGQDLTQQIAGAPHGTSVLAGLPVVGKLQ